MSFNFQPKNTYKFEVYPGGMLGTEFTHILVMAVCDYETAQGIEDVTTRHRQVLGTLPTGTPQDPALLTYLKVRTSTGNIRAMAVEWIKEETIQLVQTTTVVMTFPGVNVGDIPELTLAVKRAGFTPSKTELL